jgi:hypothetical protein
MDGIQLRISQRETAFGPVRLFIQRDDQELPEFVPQPVRSARHVPGSGTMIVQHLGFIPAEAVFTVHCTDQADFRTLVSLMGTTATLRIADMATALDAPRTWLLGERYAEIPDVELVAITEAVSFISGRVKCEALFSRSTPWTG